MKRLVLTIAILGALAAAVPALAGITVYKNNFKSRADYKQIHKMGGGKKCKREWRKRSALGFTADGGKRSCAFSTPVEGDSPNPDLFVQVVAKMTKATDKGVAKKTFVGVAIRANRKHGFQLRVFPKTGRWQIAGDGILARGTSKLINRGNKRNRLELQSKGGTLTAKVNRKHLADVQAGDGASGRGTGLVYGIRKKSKGKGKGFFDDLKVGIPNR
jgi:hypothetical protein